MHTHVNTVNRYTDFFIPCDDGTGEIHEAAQLVRLAYCLINFVSSELWNAHAFIVLKANYKYLG